jgi:hypothetical protein
MCSVFILPLSVVIIVIVIIIIRGRKVDDGLGLHTHPIKHPDIRVKHGST